MSGTWTLLLNKNKPSLSDYSAVHTNLVNKHWSSCTTLTTGFSCLLSQFLWQISVNSAFSSPSTTTSFITWTVRNSDLINTKSLLLWDSIQWSGLYNEALDLPIDFPGQWYSLKLNLVRYNNHHACLQLSFLAIMKYSKFL